MISLWPLPDHVCVMFGPMHTNWANGRNISVISLWPLPDMLFVSCLAYSTTLGGPLWVNSMILLWLLPSFVSLLGWCSVCSNCGLATCHWNSPTWNHVTVRLLCHLFQWGLRGSQDSSGFSGIRGSWVSKDYTSQHDLELSEVFHVTSIYDERRQ